MRITCYHDPSDPPDAGLLDAGLNATFQRQGFGSLLPIELRLRGDDRLRDRLPLLVLDGELSAGVG